MGEDDDPSKVQRRRLERSAASGLRRVRDLISRKLNRRGWSDADPDKVIWVEPTAIAWYLDIREWRHRRLSTYAPERGVDARAFVAANAGKVLDGDWDQPRVPFEENDVYKLLHHRFALGRPWEESEVYRRWAREIEAGERRWHWSATLAELQEAAREVEELFESIRTSGYRPAREAGRPGSDEVTVSIGRDGDLFYNNVGGHHRLSIARILGLEAIPVRVLVRHEEWQHARKEVRRRGRDALSGHPGVQVHPDIEDLIS